MGSRNAILRRLVPAPARAAARRTLRRAGFQVRRVTATSRVLPDFIVPGAMKAGTSSLFAYLSEHPRILPSSVKEVHYFDVNAERGADWYRAHFPLARRRPAGSLTGEASPFYLFHPRVPERIAALVPKVKLIVLLRDPIERAISHYFHAVRVGVETLPLREALEAEEERLGRVPPAQRHSGSAHVWSSYKSRGHYAEQLGRYFEHFPRDQILVLPSEPFFEDPHASLDEVFGFLGLDAAELGALSAGPANAGTNRQPVDPEVRACLEAHFAPHNEALYRLLGTDFGW